MGYGLGAVRLALPDVILYPTGGGTGLIGMWKAFDEMEMMGWIGSERPGWFRCSQTAAHLSWRVFDITGNGPSPGPIP